MVTAFLINTASDATCYIYIFDHGHIKVQRTKHCTDCRENGSLCTDEIINIYFIDFYIFMTGCILFECQHIASDSVMIMADTVTLPDELSFRADDAATEQLCDHVNDTRTT